MKEFLLTMGLALKVLIETRLTLSLISLLFVIYMASCTVISKDVNTDIPVDEKTYEISQTHYNDVIKLLGPPLKLSKYNDGLVFLYEYVKIYEHQLSLNPSQPIFKWLKLSFARAIADREVILLIFDKDGYLISQKYKEFGEDLGGGQAVDFLFTIESLVDASKLEEDPSIINWGASLLDPIPQSLNYSHNLGTGNSGVEQLGAPNTVGQQTLELLVLD